MRFSDLLTASVAAQLAQFNDGNLKLNVTRTDLGNSSSNITLQIIDDQYNNVATFYDLVANDAWDDYVTISDSKLLGEANIDDKRPTTDCWNACFWSRDCKIDCHLCTAGVLRWGIDVCLF